MSVLDAQSVVLSSAPPPSSGEERGSGPIDTFGHHRQLYGSSRRGQTDRKGPTRGHFLEPAVMHVQDAKKSTCNDYFTNRGIWLDAI